MFRQALCLCRPFYVQFSKYFDNSQVVEYPQVSDLSFELFTGVTGKRTTLVTFMIAAFIWILAIICAIPALIGSNVKVDTDTYTNAFERELINLTFNNVANKPHYEHCKSDAETSDFVALVAFEIQIIENGLFSFSLPICLFHFFFTLFIFSTCKSIKIRRLNSVTHSPKNGVHNMQKALSQPNSWFIMQSHQ